MDAAPRSDTKLLQAIADPLRMRILRQLAEVGPVCACDIASGYQVSQPTISHHLRVLREAGWTNGERRGTWIWYSMRPDALVRFRQIADGLEPFGGGSPRLPRLRVLQPGA
ncbi:MAG: metalloregulator ArsR/SmtB family transcription factor [Chloroflexota bacterium]